MQRANGGGFQREFRGVAVQDCKALLDDKYAAGKT
jgi:hypothetical protein